MTIGVAKALFSPYEYPLHYAWLELLEKSSTSSNKVHLMNELNELSKLMGDEYAALLTLWLDSKGPYSFPRLQHLKDEVKNRITSHGCEFTENCEKIKSLLLKHGPVECGKHPLQTDEEYRLQNLEARRESSKRIFEELKTQYDKDYIDFPSIEVVKIRRHSKAATVFKALTNGNVISESDYLWLVKNEFHNQRVRVLYYLNRAKFALREWESTKKPWNLVNAIADHRKAGRSEEAVDLVDKNFPFNFANKNKNLKSALLTTSGGAKRDLQMFDDGIKLGTQAHELTPKDYRPCTLIGACHMLLGDITQGHEWYQKAIKRGFNEDSFEQELRSIYNRANKEDKIKIKQTLIDDGRRYMWFK